MGSRRSRSASLRRAGRDRAEPTSPADAVGVVELDKVDTTQRRVSHLGFEHQAKEPRLTGRLVDEKVGMPERIARSRHRTESRRDRIPADDGIVGRRVEHDDVRSQLFHGSLHGSLHVTSPRTVARTSRSRAVGPMSPSERP